MFGQIEAAAADRGMMLADGKGNDPDTLGKRLVYVMDSNKFPFYQAEVCKFDDVLYCFLLPFNCSRLTLYIIL